MSVIFWFRQDLRLSDNPGLSAAAAAGKLLPVYILDEENAGPDGYGAASRLWLHHHLDALNTALGGRLIVMKGRAEEILPDLAKRANAHSVYWNRCYEGWRITRDSTIKEKLQLQGIEAKSYNGSLLWEPWEVAKPDGTPYQVFTPFYRRGCLNAPAPRAPLAVPQIDFATGPEDSLSVDDLGLLPRVDWDKNLMAHWQVGEAAAQARLRDFIEQSLADYGQGRDFPARGSVSRLSAYLKIGAISAHQAWAAAHYEGAKSPDKAEMVDKFCTELGWREFSYHLLYRKGDLPRVNLNAKFNHFPWRAAEGSDAQKLAAWQQGQTGYPIVDAGMRELYATGYMHNRVRMIVGSFLVKNLLLDWRHGAEWFWDCLIDADLASNSASWQWVAGCGADAAPYFRIFNPITQGEKFDKSGDYTRHWVPELAQMPDKYLYAPWTAPQDIRSQAGVQLGKSYPMPIIDVKESRQAALDAFASLKQVEMA